MPNQDTYPLKEKIVFIVQRRGPSLPIHIAQATGLSMLFSSAFLSELISDKKIKISNMKVGGSPLYFIPGQEPMLEKFSNYLKSKEREAFDLLKSKKILKDKEQDPAIRVALRAIKDFAFPVIHNEEIFWIYFTLSEQEAEELLNQFEKSNTEKVEEKIIEKNIKQEKNEINYEEKKDITQKKIENLENIEKKELIEIIQPELKINSNLKETFVIEENTKPINESKKQITFEKKYEKETNEKVEIETEEILSNLLNEKIVEKEKPKEKSEFVKHLFKWINKNNIEILIEKENKKKEWLGIGKFKTDFGDFEVVIVSKDKKRISEIDLKNSFEFLQSEKRIIFFISPGSLDKKASDFLNKYGHLIKFIQIKYG